MDAKKAFESVMKVFWDCLKHFAGSICRIRNPRLEAWEAGWMLRDLLDVFWDRGRSRSQSWEAG